MSEISCIITYVVGWFILFFTHFLKKKKLDIAGTIMLIYSTMGATSIYFYYNAPASREIFNVTFAPFIYLFFCIFICILPLIKYENKTNHIKLKDYNDKNSIKFILILLSPFVLDSFIELLFLAFNTNLISLGEAYNAEKGTVLLQLSSLGKKGAFICHFGAYLWPFLFFFSLSRDRSQKIISIIALLAYLCEILQGYVNGDRVTLVRFIIYFCIVFRLMKNGLDQRIRKRISIFGISSFLIIFILLAAITIGRLNDLSNDYNAQSFLSLYSGEGCIRFSQYIWNLNSSSNGDTCFSLIKNTLGFDTFTDNFARRTFYEQQFRIPTYIFYTYIGDLYQDLGRYGTIIFCFLSYFVLSHFLLKCNKKSGCSFTTLFLISIFLQTFIFGFMYYNFKTYNDQLQLIVPIIFFLIFDKSFKVRTYIYKK